jgi:hypothetical protein
MRFYVLFLGNSIGPWNKLYQKGALETWCHASNGMRSWSVYQGISPRIKHINFALNRLLTSRFLKNQWWAFQRNNDISKINYTISTNRIQVDVPEIWSNITIKTMVALDVVVKNFEFDYLIRANASCYVNRRALEKFIENFKGDFTYGGPILNGKQFVSGWAIVISPKAIYSILAKGKCSYSELYDDEAIGRSLKDVGIAPVSIPYFEIQSLQILESVPLGFLESIPFIRVKSSVGGNRTDDLVMRRLHQRLSQNH